MQPHTRLINLVALALALAWVALIGLTLSPLINDFQSYRLGALLIRSTGSPYLAAPPANGVAYIYPPLFAYLMLPFAWLSIAAGQQIWFLLNLALLALLVVLSVRASGSQLAQRYWGVTTLLVVTAPPTRLCLQLGQTGIVIGLALAGSIVLARRSPWLSGLLLAFAALVKVYPALLGGYYLLRRRMVLAGALASGLAIVAISLLAQGPGPYLGYVDRVVFGFSYPYYAEHNISLLSFWGRLLTPNDYGVALADAPWLARGLAFACGAAALAACVWVSRGPASPLGEQLRFGAWLAATMLLSPTNGSYMLVGLLPPLLAALRYVELTQDRQARAWLAVGAALLCWPPAWTDWQPQLYNALHTRWGLLLLTPALYGLAICFVLLVRLAWYQRQSSTSSSGP